MISRLRYKIMILLHSLLESRDINAKEPILKRMMLIIPYELLEYSITKV
jgi:hypothetical protein